VFSVALLSALCGATSASFSAPPQEVWEFSNGTWTQVKAPTTTTTQPTADATLDRIDALLDQYKYMDARKLSLAWEKQNKTSPLRDRVIYQLARSFYQYGDRVKAFYYCDELMDEYPESRLFYTALDMQFRIADAYLGGYKKRILRMPLVDAAEDGIEMLWRIQQRSPGSPLAERALLRTADYYFARGQYDLSGDAYAAFAKSYARSPAVPRVRLRAAYSSLAQFRGLRYDATPLLDAKTQFASIIGDYPDLAQEENLPDLIERIDTTFARKNDVVADFYRRTNEPRGAAYTYRHVTRTYPNTPEAEYANDMLRWLPPKAVEQSFVQGAGPLLPSTQPAGGVR
jgi:outer membrane protein assembly factor BamD (BamD/ComL family)